MQFGKLDLNYLLWIRNDMFAELRNYHNEEICQGIDIGQPFRDCLHV